MYIVDVVCKGNDPSAIVSSDDKGFKLLIKERSKSLANSNGSGISEDSATFNFLDS